MYINNRNISEYNARVLDLKINPSDFEVNVFWSKNSLDPIIDNDIKYKSKPLTVTLRLFGDRYEVARNKSNLVKDMTISSLRFNKLYNEYKGYITGVSLVDSKHSFETLEVSMEVIEEEPEQKIDLNGETTLFADGNTETPCIIEFTPTKSLVNVTITGLGEDITINNLTKDKTVTIDGEKGLVLEEGENKWKDYDSWSFPKLSPGENNISINKVSIDATLSYKARWI